MAMFMSTVLITLGLLEDPGLLAACWLSKKGLQTVFHLPVGGPIWFHVLLLKVVCSNIFPSKNFSDFLI